MKKLFQSIRDGWNEFKQDHPYSAPNLKTALQSCGVALVFAGAGLLSSFVAPAAGAFLMYGFWTFLGVGAITAVVSSKLVKDENKLNSTDETDTNLAGQTVSGKHWAIRRLETAQAKICMLTKDFKNAAALPADTQEKIAKIVSDADYPLDSVFILDADKKPTPYKYKFVRSYNAGVITV